jgi:hypothetical protein
MEAKKNKRLGCNTRTSQEVTHPSTTLAQTRLTHPSTTLAQTRLTAEF